jgi:hypothetical protein
MLVNHTLLFVKWREVAISGNSGHMANANRGICVESNKFNCHERLACADINRRRVSIAC